MTIYALSSGPGISGVAIIRVSGLKTAKVIKSLTGSELPTPRVATLRNINKINTSELIDQALVLWFPGPESYTGEDMAEFHVHGSKAVIEALHTSISKIEECRLAEPGEFTKLAFQNGKINLLKAESIADLISSETEIQRQQAIKIMNGKSAMLSALSKFIFPFSNASFVNSPGSAKRQFSIIEIEECMASITALLPCTCISAISSPV